MAAPSNFPTAGDDKAVSLRNSGYARFDLAFAQDLKDSHPGVWALGGNIKGNAQFAILSRIAKQGGVPATPAEEKAVRLREAWAAWHYENKLAPGVVALAKWLVVGGIGEKRMKDVMNEEKEKRRGQADIDPARDAAPEPAGDGGHESQDGVLVRAAHVRAVRREARPTEKDPNRKLVVVDFVASTEDIDSHDSVLVCDWAENGRLTRYLANPVLLWQHGRAPEQIPAIGHCENVRVPLLNDGKQVGTATSRGDGRQLLASAVFDDTTEFDREIAAKYEKGVLRGFSVSFASEECEVRLVDGREVTFFIGNELREISAVNIPSNPHTLATKQRALLDAAREMARASGGRVHMRDVVASLRAGATHERSDLTTGRDAPATTTTTPAAPAAPGDTMTTKTIEIQERDVRAEKGGGMSAKMACPHCEKEIDMTMKAMPMHPEKAAEAEQTRTALAEQTRLHAAEAARAQSLEDKLAASTAKLSTMLLDTARSEITARAGKKFEPHELDEELSLARMFLDDARPDPDAPKDERGNATRTMGQRKFADRLATLDKRRDLALLDGPITTGAPLVQGDPQVRDAAAGTTTTPTVGTRSGEGLAAMIDGSAN